MKYINMKSFKDPSAPRFYKEAEEKMKIATLACGAPGTPRREHAGSCHSVVISALTIQLIYMYVPNTIPTCWVFLQDSTVSAWSQGARKQWLQKWRRGAKLPWGGHKPFQYMHAHNSQSSINLTGYPWKHVKLQCLVATQSWLDYILWKT